MATIRVFGASIIDTPVERMLRERYVERLEALADAWDEEAVEHILAGRPRRAHYLETYWVKRIKALAEEARMEPLRRALEPVGWWR